MTNDQQNNPKQINLPSLERIQQELGSAKSLDDFFGKEGIFARLFASTLEQMLEAELTAQLGDEKYEAKGRNTGNSRNGKYTRKVRSSGGEVEVAVPREGCGDVPFVKGNLSQNCCLNTKRAATNWKTRSSLSMPKVFRCGIFMTASKKCMEWRFPRAR